MADHLTTVRESEVPVGGGEVVGLGDHLEDDVDAFPLVVDPVGEAATAPRLGIEHADHTAALGLDGGGGLRQAGRNGLLFEVAVEDDHQFIGPHGRHSPPLVPGARMLARGPSSGAG